MTMNVLLADDHQLVREGLKLLITQALGTVDFVEAGDYAQVRSILIRGTSLDLAVLDLNMPHTGPADQVLDQVLCIQPRLPWVVVSAFAAPDAVQRVLALPNVFAFVSKSGQSQNMVQGIQAALARQKWHPQAHASAEWHDLNGQLPGSLPARLHPVYQLIRQGKSNKAIARMLGLTEGTVKNYASEIFKHLQVNNRTQAANINPYLTLAGRG